MLFEQSEAIPINLGAVLIMLWKIILSATVLVVLAYYVLFHYNYVKPADLGFSLGDIKELIDRDNLPIKVEIISVGSADVPAPFVASSPRRKSYEFSFTSFKVSFADSSYIIIDPSHHEDSHYKFPYSVDYSMHNYEALQADLKGAKAIYFTHMHWDHIEGFSKSEGVEALKEKAFFTPEQGSSKLIKETESAVIKASKTLRYEEYALIAPGVVAIKTPGHTDCSQSFLVETVDGAYFIYGDTVYTQENIDDLKGRSLFASIMSGETSESRKNTSRVIGFIDSISKEGVVPVSSHDIETQKTQITGAYSANGWMRLK